EFRGVLFRSPVRVLYRLGGGGDPLRPGPRDERRAQPDQILLRGILRPVHTLPGRHREDAQADREKGLGPAAAEGTFPGDDGRIDMRLGTSRAQPRAFCDEILPERGRMTAGARIWTA